MDDSDALVSSTDERDCECLERGARGPDAGRTYIGMDETAGRFADVALYECHRCGRIWLAYQWEVEAFSDSGRWFAGIVERDAINTLTPESAAQVLESLPWYLRGGSYYYGKVSRRSGLLEG